MEKQTRVTNEVIRVYSFVIFGEHLQSKLTEIEIQKAGAYFEKVYQCPLALGVRLLDLPSYSIFFLLHLSILSPPFPSPSPAGNIVTEMRKLSRNF